MKVSDFTRRPNLMIMGDSGTGKTHILGTFALMLPSVVVTSDKDGIDTLASMGITDTHVVYIENWAHVWDAWDEIRVLLRNGIRAILLDDFGATQEQIIRKSSLTPRTSDEYRMNPAARSDHMRAQLLRGDRRLQYQQWGEIGGAGEAFLYEVKHSTAQIVVATVLEETRDNPRTGLDQIYPDLAGSLRYSVLSKFSLVTSAFKDFDDDGNVHWCLSSLPHPRVPTKDRVSVPRTWVNPTAERLLLHIVNKDGGEYAETDQEKKIGIGIPKP